jgi:hypothetical protein
MSSELDYILAMLAVDISAVYSTRYLSARLISLAKMHPVNAILFNWITMRGC